MVEEEIGVGVCSIAFTLGVSNLSLAIVEDYNFVDAEYGACSGDLAC